MTRLLGMDEIFPLSHGVAVILLLIAGATAGLIARESASAQALKPAQSTSTKQVICDAHGDEFKRWLNEDVRWIITPEERHSFLWLGNDEEREEFIRQFWLRRNPDRDSSVNKFKEEHYRRFSYASVHFGADDPGWKTDRGRVYIVFGPPDSIESPSAGGVGVRKPFEIWHYHSIRLMMPPDLRFITKWETAQTTVIENFDFKFVDECACGQFRLESPWPSA